MKNIYKSMKWIAVLLLFLFFNVNQNFGQVSNYFASVNVLQAKENKPMAIVGELYQAGNVSRVLLFYKSFGATEFKQVEMNQIGTRLETVIPANEVVPPFIEYFLQVETIDGKIEAFPIGAPQNAQPIQVSILPVSEKDQQIIILTPSEDEVTSLAELLISISLLKAPDNVDQSATRLFIDDNEITQMALFAEDMVLVYPDNFDSELSDGLHILRIEVYDNDGNSYHTITQNFGVVQEYVSAGYGPSFNYNLDIIGETRNEKFDETQTWYNNIDAKFRGNYQDWRFGARVYVTSEEKKHLQPLNRYSAEVSNNWMFLNMGDNFPRYPKLLLNGKRLRGVTGGVRFGVFRMEASYGQINRGIEGDIIRPLATKDSILLTNVIEVDQAKYNTPYAEVNFGTYERNLFTARLAAEGNNYTFGLSYLHGRDDQNSIDFGTRPQENAVIGTDLRFAFDDSRIEITGQAGFSVFNTDISDGTLSDEDIERIFGEGTSFDSNPEDFKQIRDLLDNVITVNEYIGPINPEELSSFAVETGIRLNYFNNNLNAEYIYRGNEYVSFGQSFIRTDVKGINLSDRIRLLDNKVYFLIGYENLQDNLQENKVATTTFQTIRSSISYYPRTNFPNVTFGYVKYINDNPLPKDSIYAINNFTDNFVLSFDSRFNAGVDHNARLSFNSSKRDDQTQFNSDADLLSTSLSFRSFWSRSFSSIFNILYSSTENSGIKYNYTKLGVGGIFRLVENKLDFTVMVSPSFGDIERVNFDLYGNYRLVEYLTLGFQARYYSLKNSLDETIGNSIFGITARLNI